MDNIKKQILENGTPKVVEVFVGSQYAPNFEMRTEHVPAVALALKAAAQK